MSKHNSANGSEEPADDTVRNESPNVTPDEETLFVADNVGEFVQRTRYGQILESRKDALVAIDNAAKYEADCRRNGMAAAEAKRTTQQAVRSSVERYILDCEMLYQQTQAGQKLWRDTTIASATIGDFLPVPEEELDDITAMQLVGDVSAAVSRDPRAANGATSIRLTFGGVREYIDFGDARAQYKYTVTMDRRGNPEKDREGTASLSTPVQVSREAFRATSALVDELSPGLDVGDAQDAVGGDYSDLLDDLDDE